MFLCESKVTLWILLVVGVDTQDALFRTRCGTIPWTYCYHGSCSSDPLHLCQCHPGYTGHECSLTCHTYCEDAVVCESSNRTHTYYTGNRCSNHTCHPLRFGLTCNQTCHCVGNISCDIVTGACPNGLCQAPYYGVNCQLREEGMSPLKILVYTGIGIIGLVAITGSIYYKYQNRKDASDRKPIDYLGKGEISEYEDNSESDDSAATNRQQVVTPNTRNVNAEGRAIPESNGRQVWQDILTNNPPVGQFVPTARPFGSTRSNTDPSRISRLYSRRGPGQTYTTVGNPADRSPLESSTTQQPSTTSDVERRSWQSWQRRKAWRNALDRQGNRQGTTMDPDDKLRMHIALANQEEVRPRYKTIAQARKENPTMMQKTPITQPITSIHPTQITQPITGIHPTQITQPITAIHPTQITQPITTMQPARPYNNVIETGIKIGIPINRYKDTDKPNIIDKIRDSFTKKDVHASNDESPQRREFLGYPSQQGQRRNYNGDSYSCDGSYRGQTRNSDEESRENSSRDCSQHGGLIHDSGHSSEHSQYTRQRRALSPNDFSQPSGNSNKYSQNPGYRRNIDRSHHLTPYKQRDSKRLGVHENGSAGRRRRVIKQLKELPNPSTNTAM